MSSQDLDKVFARVSVSRSASPQQVSLILGSGEAGRLLQSVARTVRAVLASRASFGSR